MGALVVIVVVTYKSIKRFELGIEFAATNEGASTLLEAIFGYLRR